MIDTFKVYLHGIDKFQQIAYTIENIWHREKTEMFQGEQQTKLMDNETTLLFKTNVYPDGKVYMQQHRGMKEIPSNGFKLRGFVNRLKNVIEIEFSLPKYKYGNNIAQTVWHNIGFGSMGDVREWEYQAKNSYVLIEREIGLFFAKEFPTQTKIDPQLIEIRRIDFSYNQFWKDKETAFQNLHLMKRITKKGAGFPKEGQFRVFDTGIFYVCSDYSAKIYHKGTDFQQNDYKRLSEVNRQSMKEVFNIREMQKQADRILRFEITFRPSKLSYLYVHKIWRKNVKSHKDIHRRFLDKIYWLRMPDVGLKVKYKNTIYDGKRARQIIKENKTWTEIGLDGRAKKYYPLIVGGNAYKWKKVSTEGKKQVMLYKKLIEKTWSCRLRVSEKQKFYNDNELTYDSNLTSFPFDKKLFKECINLLFDFIENFKLNTQDFHELQQKIKNNNHEAEKHNRELKRLNLYDDDMRRKVIRERRLLNFLDLVKSYGSVDEFRKSGRYAESTFRRYLKELKEYGFCKNTFFTNEIKNHEHQVNIDFHDYQIVADEGQIFQRKIDLARPAMQPNLNFDINEKLDNEHLERATNTEQRMEVNELYEIERVKGKMLIIDVKK